MENSIPNIIWQFWTGDNPITNGRKRVLESNKNIGVETRLLLPDYIMKMQVPGHPFHPAYQWLSCTQRSDYLRCYFMHFHGGGYADIKEYAKDNNWRQCFEMMDNDEFIWAIGQKERMGGSAVPGFNKPETVQHLIANCYFIMRPKTEFTSRWIEQVEQKLDKNIDKLKACWEITKNNPRISNEKDCRYPFRWAEICGNILHSLEYEYRGTGHILNCLKTGRLRTLYR